MARHTIGEAAKAAGVTPRAVRLYESRGLISSPDRTRSGYRLFTDSEIEVLTFIRRGRNLGLSLAAIGELITISDDGAPCCERARALLDQRISEIDTAIADLLSLRATIARAQQVTEDQAAGTRCVLIESAAGPQGADEGTDEVGW